jgi:hypothetical protein
LYGNEQVDSIFNLPLSKAIDEASQSAIAFKLLSNRNLKELSGFKSNFKEEVEVNYLTENSMDTV